MMHFKAEQHVFDVGGVKIGGQPGEHPTVLMAAIFYAGDKLVAEVNSADFDREKAKTVAVRARDKCLEVGTPMILDVICATEAQSRAFVGFALDEFDLPVLLDSTTPEVRRAGLLVAAERGAQDRIIFNSIGVETSDDELKYAVEMGFKTSIVMLFNPKNPTAQGKVSVADELIDRARTMGFEKLILDLAVLDIVDVGTCAAAMGVIKEEYGLPCGCSPTHTHRDRWKKAGLFSSKEQAAAKASTATMLQCAGADFLMYDIKQTEIIPAMAMVDAEIAYGAKHWKVRPASQEHPLFKVFM